MANAVISGILAVLAGLLWEPLTGPVFIIVFVVLHGAVTFLDTALVLKCPHCSKRVKARATACHHCGRVVAA